jgi:hypothetical protein
MNGNEQTQKTFISSTEFVSFDLNHKEPMETNYAIVFSTAIIPMLIGFVWYHPALLGKAWMQSAGISEEQLKGSNMAVIFGFCILFSLMLCTMLPLLVIHQSGMMSMMMGEPGIPDSPMTNPDYKMMMEKYGHNFRSFKHGVFHGILSALFFALPILGIQALFERRGAKYIFIHLGYWVITLALMGGIVCGFA